jgi:type IV fimbrial biogenesis protein FimT
MQLLAMRQLPAGAIKKMHKSASKTLIKRHKKIQNGFSLLELMVAVSIAAILLTVGIPSFQSTMLRARGATLADTLITAVYYTRSEAISRNSTIRLCASADGSNCLATNTGWNEGWIAIDANDLAIKVWGGITNDAQVQLLNLTGEVNFSSHRLVYNSLGEASLQNPLGAAVNNVNIGLRTLIAGCGAMPRQRREIRIGNSGSVTVDSQACP